MNPFGLSLASFSELPTPAFTANDVNSGVKKCSYANAKSLPSKLVAARDWSGEQPPVLLLKEVKRCWHSSSGMSFSRYVAMKSWKPP